jgi:hypothetical protein
MTRRSVFGAALSAVAAPTISLQADQGTMQVLAELAGGAMPVLVITITDPADVTSDSYRCLGRVSLADGEVTPFNVVAPRSGPCDTPAQAIVPLRTGGRVAVSIAQLWVSRLLPGGAQEIGLSGQ